MNAKIDEVMVSRPVVGRPHEQIGSVRKRMREHRIQSLPIVGPENEPVGIVSASDLLEDLPDGKPVSQVMSRKVYTVPRYEGVHVAARLMRNHHIHHLVVTHENEVTGIVSAYDLLSLVEDHRFVRKNAPTSSKRRGGRRE